MSILCKLLNPRRLWATVFRLSVSIVLLGLIITILLSHFETKHRLNIIEYQHQLFIGEIKKISDSNEKTQLAQESIFRLKNRARYLIWQSSLRDADKIITALTEIREQTKLTNYFDNIGRPDLALGTAGAQIISIGNTQVLTPFPNWLSSFGFGGISKYFINGAQRVLQPSIHPGECFAFTGPGEIVIKLIRSAFIEAVSVEHILPQMSPDGHILAAPSVFSVYGMENECDSCAVHLGTFQYDIDKNQSLQEFQLASNTTNKSFPIVKFEFAPNRGDLNYTCIYRVRVHGSLIKPNWSDCEANFFPSLFFQHERSMYVCVCARGNFISSVFDNKFNKKKLSWYFWYLNTFCLRKKFFILFFLQTRTIFFLLHNFHFSAQFVQGIA